MRAELPVEAGGIVRMQPVRRPQFTSLRHAMARREAEDETELQPGLDEGVWSSVMASRKEPIQK